MQLPFSRPQCSCPLPALNAAAIYPPSVQLPFSRHQCSCHLPALNAAAIYPPSMQLPFRRPKCSCPLPALNAAALYPPSIQLPFTRPQCSCPLYSVDSRLYLEENSAAENCQNAHCHVHRIAPQGFVQLVIFSGHPAVVSPSLGRPYPSKRCTRHCGWTLPCAS